jgi:hypothetical protein
MLPHGRDREVHMSAVTLAPRYRLGYFLKFRPLVLDNNYALRDISEGSGVDLPSLVRMLRREGPSVDESVRKVIAYVNARHGHSLDFDAEFMELRDAR